MQSELEIQRPGTVIEALEDNKFRVALENGNSVPATLSGELRFNFTRVLPGDKVLLEFSPYDLSQGRIISKHPKTT